MPSAFTLIQIVDTAVADAYRRGGHHLVCKPGCSQCCIGVFPIAHQDAARLREGLTALEQTDPQKAARIHESAAASLTRLDPCFPGDLTTGILNEDYEASTLFTEELGDNEPCPVLDPTTGTCDLYEHRPILCRTFGPPMRTGRKQPRHLRALLHPRHHRRNRRLRTRPHHPRARKNASNEAFNTTHNLHGQTLIAYALRITVAKSALIAFIPLITVTPFQHAPFGDNHSCARTPQHHPRRNRSQRLHLRRRDSSAPSPHDDRVAKINFVASPKTPSASSPKNYTSAAATTSPKNSSAPPAPKLQHHPETDIGANIASGSYPTAAMIILPCSMGTLAAIANGLAANLIQRAADVCLKENRPLILCVRETPFNRIHLRNMQLASDAGATIFPAIPTLYNHPQTTDRHGPQLRPPRPRPHRPAPARRLSVATRLRRFKSVSSCNRTKPYLRAGKVFSPPRIGGSDFKKLHRPLHHRPRALRTEPDAHSPQ